MGNTDKLEVMADVYDTPERVEIIRASADAIRGCSVDSKERNAIGLGCEMSLVGIDLLNDFSSVLFLDTSQNMIHQVKQEISDSNIQSMDTLCSDSERDSLSDLKVDYIFMVQALLHISDVGLVLSGLHQVLKEGGHLLIVDFDQNEKVVSEVVHSGFGQARLTDRMTKIGYKGIQSRTFYTGSKIFIGQDVFLFIPDSQKQSRVWNHETGSAAGLSSYASKVISKQAAKD